MLAILTILFYGALSATSASVPGYTIKTGACPEKRLSVATLDILEDSILLDIPPVKVTVIDTPVLKVRDRVYEHPGCFRLNATILIPHGSDLNDVAVNVNAFAAQVGSLGCDLDGKCASGAQDKPSGNCFSCGFCDNSSCAAKANVSVPLSWRLCPTPSLLLSSPTLKHNEDFEATLTTFLKKKASLPSYCSGSLAALYPQCKQPDASYAWEPAICKRVVVSYLP